MKVEDYIYENLSYMHLEIVILKFMLEYLIQYACGIYTSCWNAFWTCMQKYYLLLKHLVQFTSGNYISCGIMF